jgi:hypothetical protein
MEEDILEQRPRPVRTRFELAAHRLVEAWLAVGRMRVTANDMQLAREFLEESGWRVEDDVAGAKVRVARQGRTQELTREGTVMMALRRLADGGE